MDEMINEGKLESIMSPSEKNKRYLIGKSILFWALSNSFLSEYQDSNSGRKSLFYTMALIATVD